MQRYCILGQKGQTWNGINRGVKWEVFFSPEKITSSKSRIAHCRVISNLNKTWFTKNNIIVTILLILEFFFTRPISHSKITLSVNS